MTITLAKAKERAQELFQELKAEFPELELVERPGNFILLNKNKDRSLGGVVLLSIYSPITDRAMGWRLECDVNWLRQRLRSPH